MRAGGCVGQHILLDLQGAVLALVAGQQITNLSLHSTPPTRLRETVQITVCRVRDAAMCPTAFALYMPFISERAFHRSHARCFRVSLIAVQSTYRVTFLITKCTPLGPYRRSMHRVLGGSQGGGRFLMSEAPLYRTSSRRTACQIGPRGVHFLVSEVPL